MILWQPRAPLNAATLPIPEPGTVKGATVLCAGIHMSNIPEFSYDLPWGERVVRSVANLTRRDGDEFLALAPRIPIETTTTSFALKDANNALDRLRDGVLTGAAVLIPDRLFQITEETIAL